MQPWAWRHGAYTPATPGRSAASSLARLESAFDGRGFSGQMQMLSEPEYYERAGAEGTVVFRRTSTAMALLMGAGALFCTFYVAWSSMSTRQREFGTLLAIGFEPQTITGLCGDPSPPPFSPPRRHGSFAKGQSASKTTGRASRTAAPQPPIRPIRIRHQRGLPQSSCRRPIATTNRQPPRTSVWGSRDSSTLPRTALPQPPGIRLPRYSRPAR